eukprot:TRINITY_DN3551_c0_g1_i1.p1 TRINITY_DN3551_c0_g1~~TRINITY_DN3551_c0_g1_i1.p1  ORF type:complete len:402 (+),score=74.11 TRINITY_DN3551_c0_g1_i1:226-1431(+)
MLCFHVYQTVINLRDKRDARDGVAVDPKGRVFELHLHEAKLKLTPVIIRKSLNQWAGNQWEKPPPPLDKTFKQPKNWEEQVKHLDETFRESLPLFKGISEDFDIPSFISLRSLMVALFWLCFLDPFFYYFCMEIAMENIGETAKAEFAEKAFKEFMQDVDVSQSSTGGDFAEGGGDGTPEKVVFDSSVWFRQGNWIHVVESLLLAPNHFKSSFQNLLPGIERDYSHKSPAHLAYAKFVWTQLTDLRAVLNKQPCMLYKFLRMSNTPRDLLRRQKRVVVFLVYFPIGDNTEMFADVSLPDRFEILQNVGTDIVHALAIALLTHPIHTTTSTPASPPPMAVPYLAYANHRYCDSVGCTNDEENPKLSACSQCKVASYCSIACQKYGWTTHKKVCKNWAACITK